MSWSMGEVTDRLRTFWWNCPVRPRRGAKLSGVSAGIGLRYGIDPIIVRIGFVVATVYGYAGILLYLLCWLLLPKEDAELGKRPTPLLIATSLVVALFPATFAVTNPVGVTGLVVSLGALVLLHRYYKDRRVPHSVPTASSITPNTWVYPGGPASSTTAPTAPEAPAETAPSAADSAGQSPSSLVTESRPAADDAPDWEWATTRLWDPTVAPDDPDREGPGREGFGRPSESNRRNRRWISYATIGLALIATGATVIDGADIVTTLAVALGVLGAGMVIASFLGVGRGLLGIMVPLTALTLVVSGLSVSGPWRGAGTIKLSPSSVEEVRHRYELTLGDVSLNLTALPIDNEQRVHSSVRVDGGTVVVRVPHDADLTARCAVGAGRMGCTRAEQEGQQLAQHVDDPGPDGPGGGQIDLNLKVGTGSVEIIRD